MGAGVELRRYPGMPHTINEDELDACRALLGRLLEVRRLLLAGSAPRLGIGLVDLTGACCAGSH